MAKLARLECLEISSTAITDKGLLHLQELHRLKQLDICHTAVTDDGLALLKVLPLLQKVYAVDTKISHEATESERRVLPGVSVRIYD